MPLTGPRSRAVVVSKATSWDEIRRISDRFITRWIRTIVNNFEKAKAGTSMRALIRLLEGEEFSRVVDEIEWIHIDGPQTGSTATAFPILMRDVLERTAVLAGDALARNPKIRVLGAFDVTNPLVTDWIRSHAAEIVTQISEESRQAIRDLVQRSYDKSIPAQTLARMIRQSIGLTSRDALAVTRRRALLIAEGKKPELVERLTERYAAQLLRRRAEMIAKTELIKAETEGQLALWRQQAEAGFINGNLAGVSWIVTPDDRLCQRCSPLEGEIVGLGQLFEGGVTGPPLHPSCRCTVALVPEWRKLRLVA